MLFREEIGVICFGTDNALPFLQKEHLTMNLQVNGNDDQSRIETTNNLLLNRLIELAKSDSYSDVQCEAEHYEQEEYFRTYYEAIHLFADMLKQRRELFDYLTTSLKQKGFHYRSISRLFKMHAFTVDFPGTDCVRVEGMDKTIIYKRGTLKVFCNVMVEFGNG
jgi:hypothetical protein